MDSNIKKVKANPKDGYQDYRDAKVALGLMYADPKNWDVKKNRYEYSIMELFW